jgi:hypothetical protein
MPNAIKYSTTIPTGSLLKGTVALGVTTASISGPTSTTGWYYGPNPIAGKYQIIETAVSGDPDVYCPQSDAELIQFVKTKGATGANTSSLSASLAWIGTQSNLMAANFEYENIVTSGLVLNLDAGFVGSYPTTASNWYDISGNANNTTLVNGPTFNSANSGSIIFDGIDDYCNIATTQMTSNIITITGFIKWLTYTSKMFFGFTTYDVWTQGNTLGYNTGGGDVYGISSGTVTSLGLLNNWAYYTFVMTSTGSIPTNNKLYINSNLQTLSQQYGTTGNAPGFGSTLKLCDWVNGGYYGNMQYGNLQVYNKELTQAEITQNFNAQKGRFGL